MGGFQNPGRFFGGVPIARVIVFWGVYWGPPHSEGHSILVLKLGSPISGNYYLPLFKLAFAFAATQAKKSSLAP